MAKKARKKDDDEPAFEFPAFDERGFLEHEFEQFYATVIAFVLGVVIGVIAYLVGSTGINGWVPFGVGLAGILGAAFGIRSLRPLSKDYTRGDWAALVALLFFSFFGIWLLLADILRAGGH